MQTSIPCSFMRGGTSRGPFFLASDLPQDPELRNRVLLAAMGSAGHGQIDGIGGGTPLTSKVAIIGPSTHPRAQIDYLFAQVAVDRPVVDTSPNCGNMLSGVAAFAIERGLVQASDPLTTVVVHNVNTSTLIEVLQETPGGRVRYDGDAAIDGVPGTAAAVRLNFLDAAGAITGELLPTGNPVDDIIGIPVSLIDMAMPVMVVAAESVGKTGFESPDELDRDSEFKHRIEALRLIAGPMMGLGDVAGRVIPKVALVARDEHGNLVTRYFTPQTAHTSLAVTGAVCLAATAAIPGTVAHDLVPVAPPGGLITIRHPKGQFTVDLEVRATNRGVDLGRASVIRTTRKLFDGAVQVPHRVWPDPVPLAAE